jgi:hypothetical protein
MRMPPEEASALNPRGFFNSVRFGMTRAKTSEKLLEAEKRINQARDHVDRQVKLVAALKREGESAASALNTLEWLKHLLETRLASRDLLSRTLNEQERQEKKTYTQKAGIRKEEVDEGT